MSAWPMSAYIYLQKAEMPLKKKCATLSLISFKYDQTEYRHGRKKERLAVLLIMTHLNNLHKNLNFILPSEEVSLFSHTRAMLPM